VSRRAENFVVENSSIIDHLHSRISKRLHKPYHAIRTTRNFVQAVLHYPILTINIPPLLVQRLFARIVQLWKMASEIGTQADVVGKESLSDGVPLHGVNREVTQSLADKYADQMQHIKTTLPDYKPSRMMHHQGVDEIKRMNDSARHQIST